MFFTAKSLPEYCRTASCTLLAAVGRRCALVRKLVLSHKEGLGHADVDMIPRIDLVIFAAAVGIKGRVKSAGLKGLLPLIEVEIFVK